ncbi:hemerythrin domain-containing protein [Agromyces sp. SYSU K20354]|uniref:hemerythrin domain-containing protein n=1 Tax=Agromyces cavernae TaxID=2898659 RepID=UPI001E2DA2E4|nr:hemerythrin domain-containing protein [Agromyces cavernae]MCD2442326.1 hemerythrin domain-containing protein [Agromyces cavernae]
MVTRLPSSSEPLPAGEPIGCDTSDLLQVHRIFRWLYRELPGLIRGVDDGDVRRASVVADYAHMDFFGLHLHHETEDLVLWDRLVERSPGCGAHVDQMKAQHAQVAVELAEVEPLLEQWRTRADAATRDRLAAGVEHLRDTLVGHLAPEEEHIVPVATSVLTQSEWDEMGEHANAAIQESRKQLPRDVMAVQLGLMLATVPADERPGWMKTNLPAPVRLLYSLLLKRRYENAMAELYEGRPVPPIP